MAVYKLVPHGDDLRLPVVITVEAARTVEGCFLIHFQVAGHVAHINLPEPHCYPVRQDELWRRTCFEAFVGVAGSSIYTEFNFAPSTAWAAYRFDGYRAGMISPPELNVLPDVQHTDDILDLWATVDISDDAALCLSGEWQMGLTAVIEERDGTKSYWALAHAPGPPDFHNRDCWTARLPAPDPS